MIKLFAIALKYSTRGGKLTCSKVLAALMMFTLLLISFSCSTNYNSRPSPQIFDLSTNLTEASIRDWIDLHKNEKISYTYGNYEGIYVASDANHSGIMNYRIALLRHTDERYYMFYLSGNPGNNLWNEGDLKAELDLTNVPGVFIGKWYMADKINVSNVKINFAHASKFDVDFGKVYLDVYGYPLDLGNDVKSYYKIYPKE